MKSYFYIVPLFSFLILVNSFNSKSANYDIVVYGGTSAGLVAAIQAARMNKSVIIIEPGTEQQLGGLTTGGLGRTDFGLKQVIGGISLEFYKEINKYYLNDSNWVWQKRDEYFKNQTYHPGSTNPNEESMWFFEPSAARKVFQSLINKYNITVVYGERIVRNGEGRTLRQSDGRMVASPGNVSEGVVKKGTRITEIVMESGAHFKGRYFIDATYEGDLMAGAGVSFTVGREGGNIYKESLNGVQTYQSLPNSGVPTWSHHQFESGINPYITQGDPKSGFLPILNSKGPGNEGSSDHRIQSYCFRMCLTDCPENRISFMKPEKYNELDYELLFRNYEAGFSLLPWINSPMPNRKTDTNNLGAFSTDFIGANYEYPEATYTGRAKILTAHRNYQKGLMWTLANHPRIPEEIRNEIARWGLAKDEFVKGNGWQDQLYIREARRMISDVVMNQNYCLGSIIAAESIGMGAYNMDSHHTQRYIDKNGYVKNEGDVQVRIPNPYPISYKSIVPKKSECSNLFVPVCLSASHIAFGSIRMEPVFMVLGQSAAIAACIAIDKNCDAQDVSYIELEINLQKNRQILQQPNIKKQE